MSALDGTWCTHDPKTLAGAPVGMYHCHDCGCMAIAGKPHPIHEDDCTVLQALRAGYLAGRNSIGEALRYVLGIDGTTGDAQDVDHPCWPIGGTCAVCGLAPDYRRHTRTPGPEATA